MKSELPKLKRPLPSRYNSAEAQKRLRAALLKVRHNVFCSPKTDQKK